MYDEVTMPSYQRGSGSGEVPSFMEGWCQWEHSADLRLGSLSIAMIRTTE